MAKQYLEITWKEYEMYRGFQLWRTNFSIPIYAVRVGMYTNASLNLDEIHQTVDDYWKTKNN